MIVGRNDLIRGVLNKNQVRKQRARSATQYCHISSPRDCHMAILDGITESLTTKTLTGNVPAVHTKLPATEHTAARPPVTSCGDQADLLSCRLTTKRSQLHFQLIAEPLKLWAVPAFAGMLQQDLYTLNRIRSW